MVNVEADLRSWMLAEGIDFLFLPRNDAHHVEWLRPSANRLARLTGFKGSYAKLIIHPDGVSLFTIGAYLESVRQLPGLQSVEVLDEAECTPAAWLAAKVKPGNVVALDPWLHTHADVVALRTTLSQKGADLKILSVNPVDSLLPTTPETPRVAKPHPLKFAGQSAESKIEAIATQLRGLDLEAVLISAPDSICWLLNIRGEDVFDTPLVFAFALVKADKSIVLYVDPAKVTSELRDHLGEAVSLKPYKDITSIFCDGAFRSLGAEFSATSHALLARAESAGCHIVDIPDPCQLPKSIKNSVESSGARSCHVRDGIAQVRFWSWWDARRSKTPPPTELEAQQQIDTLRARDENFRSVSFTTISAGGGHASMPHYNSSRQTDVELKGNSFFLLDSGGQYLDGTTDVTRTFAMGPLPIELRRRYTQVMKGLIAASTMRFPPRTYGFSIDAIARNELWTGGVDYNHGTGHGVGSFLGVHEYPPRLRAKPDTVPLQLGMIMSIEPGYYAPGRFGVRQENLVAVVESVPRPGDEGQRLEFETLTLCPFDREPLVLEMLRPDEIEWIDRYHARVREVLSPHLDEEVAAWLRHHTEPIHFNQGTVKSHES